MLQGKDMEVENVSVTLELLKMVDVSAEQVEQFQRDGAVVLRNVFDDWVDLIREGIQVNLQSPSQYSEWLKSVDNLAYLSRLLKKTETDEGAYFDDYCNWQQIDQFRRFVFQSSAAQIAGRLMKSNSAVFYHEHVLVKEPGALKATPWHMDQPYYPVDGFQNCSLWIPVDEIGEETTLQFVRGSHLWGKMFRPRYFASETNYTIKEDNDLPVDAYEDVPVDDIDAGRWEISKWAVKPGDCIAFHMLTIHGAPGNLARTRQRRVLSTRWLGDDSILARRPWKVSPPIMGGLEYGQRIVNPDVFPLIWQQ